MIKNGEADSSLVLHILKYEYDTGYAVFGIEFDPVCALRNTINTKLETAKQNGFAEVKLVNTEYTSRTAVLQRQSHKKFNKSHILIWAVFGIFMIWAKPRQTRFKPTLELNTSFVEFLLLFVYYKDWTKNLQYIKFNAVQLC